MSAPAIQKLIESLDNDLLRNASVQKKLPALAEAVDADKMRQTLQDALIDSNDSHYSIIQCVPAKALYLPGNIMNLQYRLTIQDHFNDQTIDALVNARLFRDVAECKTFFGEILMPIARRTEGRPEIKSFAHPVAIVEHLNLALSAFPIDGLIPTLVEATDPDNVASLLRETLPDALSGQFVIQEVRLLPAQYGRHKRCVLRYSLDGLQTATQTPQNVTVYGKVDADGSGALNVAVISALSEKLQEPEIPYRFRVPRSWSYYPDLQLHLMEALPGKPFFKELLKTWAGDGVANGKTATESTLTLEEAVRSCALIAATLHGSNIKLGPQKTLEIQVAELLEEIDVLYQVFPETGAQLKAWVHQSVEFAQAFPAMPLCFSHGDFTYTQLLFDGKNGGLVDFDTVCQAEPAQDVGHYLAYLRLNIIKSQDPNSPFAPAAVERLCDLFLNTYLDASKHWIAEEEVLRGRAATYELISLIRLALHSWAKMKGSRLKQTLRLLEERIECQKQIRSEQQ